MSSLPSQLLSLRWFLSHRIRFQEVSLNSFTPTNWPFSILQLSTAAGGHSTAALNETNLTIDSHLLERFWPALLLTPLGSGRQLETFAFPDLTPCAESTSRLSIGLAQPAILRYTLRVTANVRFRWPNALWNSRWGGMAPEFYLIARGFGSRKLFGSTYTKFLKLLGRFLNKKI